KPGDANNASPQVTIVTKTRAAMFRLAMSSPHDSLPRPTNVSSVGGSGVLTSVEDRSRQTRTDLRTTGSARFETRPRDRRQQLFSRSVKRNEISAEHSRPLPPSNAPSGGQSPGRRKLRSGPRPPSTTGSRQAKLE